jgi:hypothetical protein
MLFKIISGIVIWFILNIIIIAFFKGANKEYNKEDLE